MSEAPLNPASQKEKMAQVMFEKYSATGIIVQETSKLSLYSTAGRATGIILDCGDGVTSVYPYYEGHTFLHAVKRIDFGGRDLIHYLMEMMNKSGHTFATTTDREVAREIKESLCCLSPDYDKGIISNTFEEKSHVLPDGRSITLGKERFQCPEALFNPSLFNVKLPGIHKLLFDSLMECDSDLRRYLYCNIIIGGGTALFPGFAERLASEITKLIPKVMKCKVVAPPERAYSVWIGGSILGSLSSTRFVSKKDYNEYGPNILHRASM